MTDAWKEIPSKYLDVLGAIVTGDDAPRRGCGKALRWLTDNGFIHEADDHRNGLPVLTNKGQSAAISLGFSRAVLVVDLDGRGREVGAVETVEVEVEAVKVAPSLPLTIEAPPPLTIEAPPPLTIEAPPPLTIEAPPLTIEAPPLTIEEVGT